MIESPPTVSLPPGARETWGRACFLLSRTDNLGDVVLTLPLAGILKAAFPECRVLFLGKSYTRPLIEACPWVDQFVDEAHFPGNLTGPLPDVVVHVFPNRRIARDCARLGIRVRIGTRNRWFHWLTCTHRPAVSRRKSGKHEARLNLDLLAPILGPQKIGPEEIGRFLSLARFEEPTAETLSLLVPGKTALVLHPKSKGSAREWGLERFGELIRLLDTRPDIQVYISGTEEEGRQLEDWLKAFPGVISICGKLKLGQFIAFLAQCQGLVAASTGPLHIASALGIRAVGLYVPFDPLYPTRWAPIGPNSAFLVTEVNCDACRKSGDCACIRSLEPARVLRELAL